MIGTWIDYSGGRVSGKTMAANNIIGAIRYVGIGGSGKRLTRAEYADHCAQGRLTVAVVEKTTTDADGGYNAGVANAQAAVADLAIETQGLPPIPYILAANDKPSYIPADVDYVHGFRDVFANIAVVGPYGFGSYLAACSAAGLAPIAWQAGPAPSRTGTSAIATWWQRNGGAAVVADGPANPTVMTLDGITVDLSNQLLEVPMTDLNLAQQIAVNSAGAPVTLLDVLSGLYNALSDSKAAPGGQTLYDALWQVRDLATGTDTDVKAGNAANLAAIAKVNALDPTVLENDIQGALTQLGWVPPPAVKDIAAADAAAVAPAVLALIQARLAGGTS